MLQRLLLFAVAMAAGVVLYAVLRADDARGSRARPAGEAPAGRCAATTGSGARCSRDAEPGSRYCWQHG